MLKKMKKKFSFLKYLFVVPFALLSCVLLGSWDYNPQTNEVKSSNLYSGGTITMNDEDGIYRSNIDPIQYTGSSLIFMFTSIPTTTDWTISLYNQVGNTQNLVLEFTRQNFTYLSSYGYYYVSISSFPSSRPINLVVVDDHSGRGTRIWENPCIKESIKYGRIWEPYNQSFINESEYNTLEEDYATLQDDYNSLYENYLTLQDDYNDLYERYQELLTTYNTIQSTIGIDVSQYSLKLGTVPSQNSLDFTPQYTLNTSDYLNVSGYLDMYSIYEDYIGSQTYGNVLEVTCPVSNIFNKDLIYNFTSQPNAIISVPLNVNGVIYNKSYELDNINPDLLTGFSLLGNISYDTSISSADWSYCTYTSFYIVYTNVGNNLTSIQIGSNNGFNTGYVRGVESQKSIVGDLTVQVQDLQQQYDSLQTSYNALNTNYLILQNQYNEIANSDIQLNFSTLIWNIASTPFEAFKTMWNFNFLGFNIYQFVSR